METRTPFGQWLRQRRHLLDLTQADLAAGVGVSAVTIRKLEAGDRKPSRDLAKRLAIALCVPEREHAAFMHFARSDDLAPSLPLPAWDVDLPRWRSGQLPAVGPPPPNTTPPTVQLHYDLFARHDLAYQSVGAGRYLARVEATGAVSGDVEGVIEVQITQLLADKPPGFDYTMAVPTPIGARFTVRSADDAFEGSYAGTMTPMMDVQGNGEARVQATGRVFSVTAGFVDLFLHFLFVEDVVKMIEGQGTGASGVMRLRAHESLG